MTTTTDPDGLGPATTTDPHTAFFTKSNRSFGTDPVWTVKHYELLCGCMDAQRGRYCWHLYDSMRGNNDVVLIGSQELRDLTIPPVPGLPLASYSFPTSYASFGPMHDPHSNKSLIRVNADILLTMTPLSGMLDVFLLIGNKDRDPSEFDHGYGWIHLGSIHYQDNLGALWGLVLEYLDGVNIRCEHEWHQRGTTYLPEDVVSHVSLWEMRAGYDKITPGRYGLEVLSAVTTGYCWNCLLTALQAAFPDRGLHAFQFDKMGYFPTPE